MLYEYLRLFKYDGTSFTDYSLANQEEAIDLTPALTSTDYLYMAHNFPVTNIFPYVGDTVNTAAANIKIEYWGGQGNGWIEAVDILDASALAGVPFTRPGNIQWVTDNGYSWNRIADSSENYAPAELQTLASAQKVTLYNTYWMRISYDSDLDAGLKIKEISYAFTTTQELDNIDVEISCFYEAIGGVSKSDWIPEIMTASKMLVIDLKHLGLIDAREQVIRFDDVFIPATYKTLDLIYMNLGPSYIEKRKELRKLYDDSLDVDRFTFDSDMDGELDSRELQGSIKRLVR